MPQRREITVDLLRELLDYNPESGSLTWKPRSPERFGLRASKIFNARRGGKAAFGAIDTGGYHCSCLFGKFLLAHRVIWAMAHGEWPEQVDHIDGNRLNNRLSNLRAATQAENSRNMARTRINSSGVSGVYWSTRDQRWRADINVGANQRRCVGLFRDFEEAVAARRGAERRHGYHPNHGRENTSAA
jgi:hypothetical protein